MLRGCRPDVARRIRLRVVGSLSAGQKIHMRPEDRRFLDVVGYRTHADAVREMADADALVLTTPTVEGGRFCIPAKTYEYLAFGGHVIASVHAGTYLEQLLRRAGGCTRVDNPSPDAWRRAIETTYDQWHDGPPARPNRLSVLSALRRDVQAASLARILEDCVTDARPSPAATRVGVAGA
jgi:glycosyltransferase involved in cell wall biosynthesis